MRKIALIVSCEHAVDTVPEIYQQYFASYSALLQTHRGIDFGALTIAKHLQSIFGCDFIQAQATRLLIDCNRSLRHPRCFSEISTKFSKEQKRQLIEQFYLPFRHSVEQLIGQHIAEGRQVLHLSIHSFTPMWMDIVRNADIGLLYDPRRDSERNLARQWQQQLKLYSNTFRIRLNYPYRGVSDGFTSTLREQFADKDYAGLEVESNQTLIADEKSLFSLADILALTLKAVINH